MVKCFLRDNEIFYEYSSYSQCLLPTGLKPIVNSHTELYPSKKVSLKSVKKTLLQKYWILFQRLTIELYPSKKVLLKSTKKTLATKILGSFITNLTSHN